MPLTLNQRHKSSEEYFSLLHIVILFLQSEFNFKISPLSSAKAGPFPFLEFLLCSISAACFTLWRISSTFLHQLVHHQGGLHCSFTCCREPGELGPAPPVGTSAALPHQHIEEDGETHHLTWEAQGRDHSCSTGSSMGVPAQAMGLLSLLPAPSLLIPAVPQFPFRCLPNTGVA